MITDRNTSDVKLRSAAFVSLVLSPRPPVVPSQKVGLGWVPGGSKYLVRRYLEV